MDDEQAQALIEPQAPKRDLADRPRSPRKRRRSRFATAPEPSSSNAPTHRLGLGVLPLTDAIAPGVEPHGFTAGLLLNTVNAPQPLMGRVGRLPGSSAVDLSAIPVAPVSTLKINQQAARTEKIQKSLKVLEGDLLETDPSRNAYFDPDIRMDGRTRRAPRRDFRSVAHGSITAQAEKDRCRAERKAADARFREAMAARVAQVGSMPELPPLDNRILDESRGGGVPVTEWWDVPFLQGGCYPTTDADSTKVSNVDNGGRGMDAEQADVYNFVVREDRITHYVHHPVRISSYKSDKLGPVLPLMLTEKERKRLRRQRRAEKEKERQEMVAVGLLPPPPPKVKLSNLMRVLANEASADPTRVEADVRAQVEERQRKHDEDNEARKKTKEEIRDKNEHKIQQDREAGVQANVYRILSVASAQHRYKVDINARQLGLTGVFVVFEDCNIVVVEGGAKALRRYKKLMLRRIDWSVPSAGDESDRPAGGRPNHCVLIWEGPIAEPAFDLFKTVTIPTENGVTTFFRRKRVGAYADLALSWTVGDDALGVRKV
jgi:U4/U6 small nuclear ribonucleoprotein PRP3